MSTPSIASRHPLSSPFPRPSALAKQRLSSAASADGRAPSPPHDDSNTSIDHIPGEPGIDLREASVCDFLSSQLDTTLLDELYNHLWLVARKSGKSVDPLNKQRVKMREIVAAEDIRLHLVWHRNKIYIKPMPLCLLNFDFWTTYLPLPAEEIIPHKGSSVSQQRSSQPTYDRKVGLGFMRSYALLVRHHVDFVLACESHLFPTDFKWEEWSKFIAHFRHIEDEEVANRYHYGQLRLSRLDWALRLFRPSSATTLWFYELPFWSTGMYVERAIAPFIFGFASLSLGLSAMQVLVSVPEEGLGFSGIGASSLAAMRRAFWIFSVMMLLLLGLVWILLFVIPAGVLVWQLSWGFKHRGKTSVNANRGNQA
ncbi:hypothetical protein EK21DRAFT_83045 [Setomelanomma holmii]|uniref:Uncharacterized protein n=1 Tax=Setomelanomma holmii TaxID=210430 RepID=A0A9P4GW56_9PLEO|nr:hypothetical protein EK21DRAFT_83045 [Setomelanomma holmii]